MKYYAELVGLGCFSHSDVVRLVGSDTAAYLLMQSYVKKGLVERIRRDLYVTISLETQQPISTRYQIATKLSEDACLSHHSAFEFYGYANQVFYEVYIATHSRFNCFDYDGVSYRRIAPHGNTDAAVINGVRVTSVERAVVDSICDFEKIGGLEETLRCIQLIPSLNSDKLLTALAEYGSGFLYQKTGYVLEALNDGLHLPDSFFAECKAHISGSKKYLSQEREGYVLHGDWKLFAPDDLQKILNKGVSDYNAV